MGKSQKEKCPDSFQYQKDENKTKHKKEKNENACDENTEQLSKKSKKEKKRKNNVKEKSRKEDSHMIYDQQLLTDENDTEIKTKKKKSKTADTVLDNEIVVDNVDLSCKIKEKKKKSKNKNNDYKMVEVERCDEDASNEAVKDADKRKRKRDQSHEVAVPTPVKKKKKHSEINDHKSDEERDIKEKFGKKNKSSRCKNDVENAEEVKDILIKKIKKKKSKCKDDPQDIENSSGEIKDDFTYNGIAGKKKKSKRKEKAKDPLDSNDQSDHQDISENKHECKDKRKVSSEELTNLEDISLSSKKKKKKTKKKSKYVEHLTENNVENSLENDIQTVPCEHTNEDQKMKKKKKKKSNNITKSEDEDDKTDGDYHTSDIKKNNDNDKPFNGNVSEETNQNAAVSNMGQWGSAAFSETQRQQKFFRLLGGFKKGTSDSQSVLPSSPNSSGPKQKPFMAKFNMALNRKAEETLNRNLESQFDKALELRLSATRGGGLGFTAPPGEGKKFHIDVNSSKSVKFD